MSEKRKLLLADDSITIQKVVNLTFADEGIEVISVGDGDSAMRKFDEFMPDLVMADVNMPGLSGYEVCRIIKCTEETQDIPVILLVGSFEPFDEAAAKDAGADDFLTKPFQSIRQLVNKVTDLLNQRGHAGAAPPAEEEMPAAPADSFAETLKFDNQPEPTPAAREQTPETTAPAAEEPQESAAANVSSESDASNAYAEIRPEFENTQEFPSEFGDAGMDDEMIETSPASEFAPEAGAADQSETAADYGKTQQMSAEEFKSFDLPADEKSETEAPREFENRDAVAENYEQSADSFEPPSFNEEARKMGFTTQSYDRATEDRPEIAETEPQIDYYLPEDEEFEAEPEFEKELTDAETLGPDVSYETESPRTPDFSQAPDEDQSAGEATTEETGAAEETGAIEIADEVSGEVVSSGGWPTSLAEETRLREASEGAEAMPEAEIDLSGVGEPVEQPQPARDETPYDSEAGVAEAETDEDTETESLVSEAPQETAAPVEETDAETPIADEAAAAPAPALDLDEGDLLELPPLVEETGIRPQPKPQPLVPEVVAQSTSMEPESKITVTKTVAESEIALSFPPELIEAIAQKVADKISAKTLTEVLPQITEMVIRKLAEEKKE